MTQEENEEFNRIEMESRIKQEYIRTMRKTTREEKISRPAVYEVPTEQESVAMPDYLHLMEELALARVLIRELGDRLAKLEKPWVGLTDEEIDALHTSIKVRLMGTFDTKDIYRVVEQALKEKNT